MLKTPTAVFLSQLETSSSWYMQVSNLHVQCTYIPMLLLNSTCIYIGIQTIKESLRMYCSRETDFLTAVTTYHTCSTTMISLFWYILFLRSLLASFYKLCFATYNVRVSVHLSIKVHCSRKQLPYSQTEQLVIPPSDVTYMYHRVVEPLRLICDIIIATSKWYCFRDTSIVWE